MGCSRIRSYYLLRSNQVVNFRFGRDVTRYHIAKWDTRIIVCLSTSNNREKYESMTKYPDICRYFTCHRCHNRHIEKPIYEAPISIRYRYIDIADISKYFRYIDPSLAQTSCHFRFVFFRFKKIAARQVFMHVDLASSRRVQTMGCLPLALYKVQNNATLHPRWPLSSTISSLYADRLIR